MKGVAFDPGHSDHGRFGAVLIRLRNKEKPCGFLIRHVVDAVWFVGSVAQRIAGARMHRLAVDN